MISPSILDNVAHFCLDKQETETLPINPMHLFTAFLCISFADQLASACTVVLKLSRVGISIVINAGPLLTFINRNSYSSEAKWTYRRSSFGVVYFTTSKWAYQQLHQVSEYVKRLWESAVNERKARHWFQKFRSGDLSLCDKARTGRPQALDDEALQAAIEEDSSQTCGELLDNSTLPVKRLDFVCTVKVRRTG
ncbi:histone-lysine N-methyltransferase SETMAR [Trichonephila inaurata madagascariensis]|uniref:Histone-lysine N-methyltransferase SETMAR n=1 Tax=Trichonephila inaurata madagascariensis TaxID=2747483 RepID=A0A8X6M767_9ARAC|nr:histone-lysine N-methyltransferase SETMAR [Trichonephila inaurata madagascariensis]